MIQNPPKVGAKSVGAYPIHYCFILLIFLTQYAVTIFEPTDS